MCPFRPNVDTPLQSPPGLDIDRRLGYRSFFDLPTHARETSRSSHLFVRSRTSGPLSVVEPPSKHVPCDHRHNTHPAMTTRRSATPTTAQILLVEDNPGDVRLTKEAFKQGRIENDLHVVSDGTEALEFLHQRNEYADAPRPDLILLDLNLPRTDGEEVLEELKGDSELRSIPVIVLTSSRAEEDVAKSYELHANAYLTKPVDPDEFIETVRAFEKFWFSVVRLPPEGDQL
ncbi:response regulator receiver protein [Natrialba magadii ATCC 43099]|uniref:Response regulator receiver protein n=2 Tax=Natrialba magadii (strain ATCC 43099 / DSM 3394 / CCM 3739 / CIP 104546 / IAM 13178 / JCM 8861 / NBRC 102185 / NCIMB 2190 / MS3) TaxID=547559 RepID=L9V1Y7_NATMM|nr:response regulator receiver protein [Natrialba magadii ATCC 43099]